ncbi:MAG: sensor histidine kinase [Bacteroidales bacterium]
MKFDFSRNKFLNLLTSPFFLAIPFTLLFIILLIPDFQPYKMEIKETGLYREDEDSRRIYIDIDNNESYEYLHLFNYITFGSIMAYQSSGAVYETWNLKGFWYDLPDFELADLDRNGTMEIYTLTINEGDSIFAGKLEFEKKDEEAKYKYVTHVKRYNGVYDFYMQTIGIEDITGDEFPDFVFTIGAGFTLQPRGIYAWDIKNDTILKSPFAGLMYKYINFPAFKDINEDNIPELFLTTVATDNYDFPVEYPDTSSYSVVLTEDLSYLFSPVQVVDRGSISTTLPIKNDNEYSVFCASFLRRGKIEKTEFKILDQYGRIVKEKVKNYINSKSKYINYDNKILCTQVGDNETKVQIINENLEFKDLATFDERLDLIGLIDTDNNSNNDLVLFNPEINKLIIFYFENKRLATLQLPPKSFGFKGISIKHSGGRQSELLVETSNSFFRINLQRNSNYDLKLLFYIAYYFIILILLLLIQKIFIYRNNRKKETQEKLINFQLQSIMNQLNPHFTFNAINSIGGAILTGKNEEAYKYFTKLSGLIRKSMKNAFQPYKTLEDEIEFVKEYLEIEAYRFVDKLSWKISIANDVDKTILVPKMLLHIFVENAIKHGLFHKEGKGQIIIDIRKTQDQIRITIDDDGIGIEEAIKINNEVGEGLKILENYLQLFREIQHTAIKFEIIPKSKKFKSPGTHVNIIIKPGK